MEQLRRRMKGKGDWSEGDQSSPGAMLWRGKKMEIS